MHSEQDLSVKNYRYIKLYRHRFILSLTVVLYFITQLVMTLNIDFDQADNQALVSVVIFIFMLSTVYYVNRYRFDYVLYKYIFSRSQKMRYIYTRNQLIGPLFVYLVVIFTGIYGMLFLIWLSFPGRDYHAFRSNALALNQNYFAIQELINELNAGDLEDYDEQVGVIKYNISMYNMYEIALFDEQAVTIDFEQMVKNANDIGSPFVK